MKRFMAVMLCMLMFLSTAGITAYASESLVTGIEQQGYLMDEDGREVDMGSSADTVPFGKSVFYPLIGPGSGNKDNLKKQLDEAKAELLKATQDRDAAKTELATIKTELDRLSGLYDTAKSAHDASVAASNKAQADYTAAEQANGQAVMALTVATSTANAKRLALETLLGASDADDISLIGKVQAKVDVIKAKQTAIDNAMSALGGEEQVTKIEAFISAKKSIDAQLLVDPTNPLNTWHSAYVLNPNNEDPAIKALYDLIDAAYKPLCDKYIATYPDRNYDTTKYQALVDAKAALTEGERIQRVDMETAITTYNDAKSAKATAELAKLEAEATLARALSAKDVAAADVPVKFAAMSTAESNKSTQQSTYNNKNGNMQNMESFVTQAQDKVNKAQTAYDNGTASAYVTDYSATSGVKVRQEIKQNRTAISEAKVVRKRTSNGDTIAFLEVSLKELNTTKRMQVSGRISLRKTGTSGYEYDDVYVDVDFEAGYQVARGGSIPMTPEMFEKGISWSGGEEELYFDADSDSFMLVNTDNQGNALLALNCDYDDDIARKHGGADMEFWNGNYGELTRVATISLYAPDKGFLYSIDKSDNLTLITPTWDKSDESYKVRSRVLGRYVLSDKKLNVQNSNNNNNSNNSSDNSNSSSNSDGTTPGTTTPDDPANHNPNTGKPNPGTGPENNPQTGGIEPPAKVNPDTGVRASDYPTAVPYTGRSAPDYTAILIGLVVLFLL